MLVPSMKLMPSAMSCCWTRSSRRSQTPCFAQRMKYIVGGYSGGGLTTENGTYLGVDPLLDPYRTVTVPAYSGCNSNNYKLVAGKTDTKNIGSSGVYVFCKGLELEGNSSLTLGPGTFIISGTTNGQGQLKIASNATLNASSGTTII